MDETPEIQLPCTVRTFFQHQMDVQFDTTLLHKQHHQSLPYIFLEGKQDIRKAKASISLFKSWDLCSIDQFLFNYWDFVVKWLNKKFITMFVGSQQSLAKKKDTSCPFTVTSCNEAVVGTGSVYLLTPLRRREDCMCTQGTASFSENNTRPSVAAPINSYGTMLNLKSADQTFSNLSSWDIRHAIKMSQQGVKSF